MIVHLIVKSTATNFVVAEAKASINDSFVYPEPDKAVAEQEFNLFINANGRLGYFESPKGLMNFDIESLYAYAARICAEKGLRVSRAARTLPLPKPVAAVVPTITPKGLVDMLLAPTRGRPRI